MYIPEFWAGVIATIIAELVLVFVAAFIAEIKKNKK